MGIDASMEVRFAARPCDADVSAWNYEIGAAFGIDAFCARPERGERPLVLSDDGLTLGVRLFLRYYGPGYERGPCHLIVGIGDWLERRTGGAVYYGGDAYDADEYAPFDRDARDALMAHLASPRGRGYYAPSERYGTIGPDCPLCERPSVARMWCGTRRGHVCLGCGWRVTTITTITEAGKTRILGAGWPKHGCHAYPGDPGWEARP